MDASALSTLSKSVSSCSVLVIKFNESKKLIWGIITGAAGGGGEKKGSLKSD